MLKKLRDGLIFGFGFSLACVLVAYLALGNSGLMNFIPSPKLESNTNSTSQISFQFSEFESEMFYGSPIDDQIEKASAIAIAEYEEGPDGKMKAIIKEFLKKDDGITIYYEVGNEFYSSSYYPEENIQYGEGVILFFIGSPASMRMSMSYDEGRIIGLGDLPLKLLREKCKAPSA